MNLIKKGLIGILSSALLITSCNLPSEETAKATQTALFETVVAGITQTMAAKPTDTPSPLPTSTLPSIPATVNPQPIASIVPPVISTVVVTPCNRATFVADVTVPDGTKIAPGTSFKKTWRLQNSGTCTWTSGYTIVYVAGDRMGAPESDVITTSTVAPGQNVDISITMTAPTTPGTYAAYFRLRSADGVQFGVLTNASGTFYCQIVSTGATPTVTGTATGTPTITGLSPASATVGSSDIVVTLTGAYYVSGAVVKWENYSLSTNFHSSTQLTATVPYQYLTTAGDYQFKVVNPDGSTSSVATFWVVTPTAVPTNTTIPKPSIDGIILIEGDPPYNYQVVGGGFVNGASVNVDGSPVQTSYKGASELHTIIPSGQHTITVTNPGGETSNEYLFTVP